MKFPTLSRRGFVQAATFAMMASNFGGGHRVHASATDQTGNTQGPSRRSPKALVFDVFGTVVDWRSSVAAQVQDLAKRKGFAVDGAKFADAWRAAYGPSMNRVRTGELPWTKLDVLHRMSLDHLLADFNITGLSEAEKVDLNRSWHRLKPW